MRIQPCSAQRKNYNTYLKCSFSEINLCKSSFMMSFNQTRELIANSSLEIVFKGLIRLFDENTVFKDLRSDLLALSSSYQRLKSDKIKGLLNFEDERIANNKIVDRLINLVDLAEQVSSVEVTANDALSILIEDTILSINDELDDILIYDNYYQAELVKL
jgi:hypothetical protein